MSPQIVWTDEMVKQLKDLRRTGHSFSQCSRRIGMSRNSCISKASRLGLTEGIAKKRGRPAPALAPWSDPDPRDPEHAIDTRDLAILDCCKLGAPRVAIAREFSVPQSLVDELWRVREAQEPVGEMA